jgi:hypothetical protein
VSPEPSLVLAFHDGAGYAYMPFGGQFRVVAGASQRGFCGATRELWAGAAAGWCDYVFYLEHDFEFLRPVDLTQLAVVLDANPALAQMALMRDAVNAEEKAAGGLYESRPGQYAKRDGWLEHSAYLTTNPSLMSAEFMRRNPWPDYPDRCEGRFGIDLLDAGYRFGAWGTGEPWVRHIGERTGFGY